MGFPPLQEILPDCRAQLCLFGNSVSPVQVIWVLANMYQSLGLMTARDPKACLCDYLRAILVHRDVTWPSPRSGVGNATLDFPQSQSSVQISFHTKETIGNLIRAEATLQFDAKRIRISCEGLDLPEWAFVQERSYQIAFETSEITFPVSPVPVCLDYLGVRKLYVVPASFTIGTFLAWVGIQGYQTVVNEQQIYQHPKCQVSPWSILTVHLDPDDVDFELSLRLAGFGLDSTHEAFGFRFTETWTGTGLWHVDQLVKSNLLASWAGCGFQPLTVWLPSFAAAVVELWPSSVEESLRAWVSVPTTCL